MAKNTHRRLFGLFLGLAVGLSYGLLSQGINHLVMPGVPVYHPLFGFWGNVLLSAAIGAVLGLVTAWSSLSAWGVFWGSSLGAALISLVSLLTGSPDQEIFWLQFGMLLMVFIPVAGACAILLVVFRWVVQREMDGWIDYAFWSRPRAALPAALILAAAFAGSLSVYPPVGRAVTVRMHRMLQEGQRAASREALPEPLRSREVTGFLEMGRSPYQLEWEQDPNNRYRIARPLADPYEPTTVVARFGNGWMLACVFPNSEVEPVCKEFSQPLTFRNPTRSDRTAN